MIERTAERDAKGQIVRVLEHRLTPAEELLERSWSALREALEGAKELTAPIIRIAQVPAGADSLALIEALCDRIVRHGFQGSRWERLRFEVKT